MRNHPMAELEPLPLDPVNPKHEILKSLMWDMGFGHELGYLRIAFIPHPPPCGIPPAVGSPEAKFHRASLTSHIRIWEKA